MFNNNKKKIAEYNKEYLKICDSIKLEDIQSKELIVIYDDIIPDLFIKIDILDNKYVNEVYYDIYSSRINKIRVVYPNGVNETYSANEIILVAKEVNDELYTCSWEDMYILTKYNDYEIKINILDMINEGLSIYIEDYWLKPVDMSKK